jgi:hypothetical protein
MTNDIAKDSAPKRAKRKPKKVTSGYWSPTPKRFRAIGDAILGAGSTLTLWAIDNNHKQMSIAALILTVAGKFLTNCFKED